MQKTRCMRFFTFFSFKDLEVRFIEYMPFDGNRWSFEKLVPQKELEERIHRSIPDVHPLPLEPHHTAKVGVQLCRNNRLHGYI